MISYDIYGSENRSLQMHYMINLLQIWILCKIHLVKFCDNVLFLKHIIVMEVKIIWRTNMKNTCTLNRQKLPWIVYYLLAFYLWAKLTDYLRIQTRIYYNYKSLRAKVEKFVNFCKILPLGVLLELQWYSSAISDHLTIQTHVPTNSGLWTTVSEWIYMHYTALYNNSEL